MSLKPPTRPSGKSPQAIFVKWVWDSIVALTREDDAREQVPVARVRQFILTDETKDDYFVCRRYAEEWVANGVVGTRQIGKDDYYVAKPHELRVTPFKDLVVVVSIGPDATLASWLYTYTNATYRVLTNQEDAREQKQTIIPRFIPAVVSGGDEPTTATVAPTIIYAVQCGAIGLMDPLGFPITLLAINDGWAWSKTT